MKREINIINKKLKAVERDRIENEKEQDRIDKDRIKLQSQWTSLKSAQYEIEQKGIL